MQRQCWISARACFVSVLLLLTLGLTAPLAANALEKLPALGKSPGTIDQAYLSEQSAYLQYVQSLSADRAAAANVVGIAASVPVAVVDSVGFDAASYSLVQGSVRNDYSYPVRIRVFVTTRDALGNVVETMDGYAHSAYVRPGEVVSFGFFLSTQAWSNYSVTAAGDPVAVPEPVHLTHIGTSVQSILSDFRTWTVTFRNDSGATVTGLTMFGVESDPYGLTGTVLGYDTVVVVPPGGTVTRELSTFASAVSPFLLSGVQAEGHSAAYTAPMPVYRFRNLKNGYFLWTADEAEKANIIAKFSKTWIYEGIAYQVNTANPLNTSPLWRFVSVKGGFYLYTANPIEKDSIIANLSWSWRFEGPAYNVSTDVSGAPVWRFRNKINGTYLFTADPAEKDNIVAKLSKNWLLEGPAYYLAP